MTSPTAVTEGQSEPVHVAFISEEEGVGAFASQDYRCGDFVLREPPYVFAQSYRTWDTALLVRAGSSSESNSSDDAEDSPTATTSSGVTPVNNKKDAQGELKVSKDDAKRLAHVRCCFGCGAPLPHALYEECLRLDCLVHIQQTCSDDLDAHGDDKPREKNLEAGSVGLQSSEASCWSEDAARLSLWELIHRTDTADYVAAHRPASGTKRGSSSSSNKSDDSTSSNLSTTSQSCRPYVTEIDVTGTQHVVYFCSIACEEHALQTEGKCLVCCPLSKNNDKYTPLHKNNCTASFSSYDKNTSSARSMSTAETEALRYPSYATILHTAQHPTSAAVRCAAWPTKLALLSTVHAIARRCNERVWLLLQLLAKELQRTLKSTTGSTRAWAAASAASTFDTDVESWVTHSVAVPFRARMDELCAQYAEGAMQLLTSEQKALLRFSWQLLTWWWVLCCMEVLPQKRCLRSPLDLNETAFSEAYQLPPPEFSLASVGETATLTEESVSDPHGVDVLRRALHIAETIAFPLQLYLQLYWLTNANVHMYVVASPLYTLWCRWLSDARTASRPASPAPSASHFADVATAAGEDVHQTACKRELFSRLYSLFHGSNVWSAKLTDDLDAALHLSALPADVLHATGVALYSTATKLNHSCAPNVCFQPNSGAVEASVVALRDIAAGEQIFTSYIRPEQFDNVDETGEVAEAARQAAATEQRRRYLLKHYGFVCNCPLCTCNAKVSRKRNGT